MFLTLRILSLIVLAVFVAVGLAVASAVLPLVVCLSVLAGMAALGVRKESPRVADSPFGRSPLRLAAGVAAAAVLAVYALIGMTALLGGAASVLTVATVLAVLGHRRLRASARSGAPAGTLEDAADEVPGLLSADPTTLSTPELCRAWRLSYLQLRDARVPEALDDASELRRRYLDELDRRQPEGFRRWLDDGARAGSDPSPYIGSSSPARDRDDDQAA